MGTRALVVCDGCGEVLEDVAERIESMKKDATRYKTTITNLYKELEDKRLKHKFRAEAFEVFEDWKTKIQPSAREFSGARFDKVAARLSAGAAVLEMQFANSGAKAFPYMVNYQWSRTGKPSERYQKMETIFKSEQSMEDRARLGLLEGLGEDQAMLDRLYGVEVEFAPDADVIIRREKLRGQLEEFFEDRGLNWGGGVAWAGC